jgi:parallel beta-helix repeat protein
VKVLFQANCKFIVDSNATLRAIGTEQDTILFDVYIPNNHWRGIRFYNASDSCRLEYCHLTNGYASGTGGDLNGGAISCTTSNPIIQSCLIDSCIANNYGGGIYCSNSNPCIISNTIIGNSAAHGGGIRCHGISNPFISNNTIIGNSASEYGGGIYCYNSSPNIYNNTISGNFANYGGGIRCNNSSDPIICDNIICGNEVSFYGGGIYCTDSDPRINGNIIFANSAVNGGGINCYNSNPLIYSNTISENSADSIGGGIFWNDYSTSNNDFHYNEISNNAASLFGGGMYLHSLSFTLNVTLNKCTIVSNSSSSGGGIYIDASNISIVNSIIWGNTPDQIMQDVVSNVHVIYSDIEGIYPGLGNISADPIFFNPIIHDYHLRSGSPCIDTGDPDTIYNDPDGSRADMGCYPYDSTYNSIKLPSHPGIPQKFALFHCYPNPFNSSVALRFELSEDREIELKIFDISGREVASIVNGQWSMGEHSVVWNAEGMPSGMYFIRLMVGGGQSMVQKVVLMK